MEHQDWKPITLSTKNIIENKQKTREISQRGEKEGKLVAPSNLGQLIAKGRTAKQMTQKLLAQRLEIGVTVLSRIESGKEIPSNTMIAKIQIVLGVQLPRATKVALTD